MKITKDYLRTVIKEELQRMEEARTLNINDPMFKKLKIIANKVMSGAKLEKDEENLLSQIQTARSRMERGIPAGYDQEILVNTYLTLRNKA